jgi:hypothetical protein
MQPSAGRYVPDDYLASKRLLNPIRDDTSPIPGPVATLSPSVAVRIDFSAVPVRMRHAQDGAAPRAVAAICACVAGDFTEKSNMGVVAPLFLAGGFFHFPLKRDQPRRDRVRASLD